MALLMMQIKTYNKNTDKPIAHQRNNVNLMDEMATPSKQVWLDSVSVTLPNYLISALTKPRSQFTRSNLMDAPSNFF